MLTPGFVGIPVTAGTHHAVVTYHQSAFREPLMICGLFILCYLLFPKIQRLQEYLVIKIDEHKKGGLK
jgi:hypothetical protein